MILTQSKTLFILAILMILLSCEESFDYPRSAIRRQYTVMEVHGFMVYAETEALKRATTDTAITILGQKLEEITEFEFREGVLFDLQQVKIFLEWERAGGPCGVYYGDEPDEKNESVGFENVETFIRCIQNGQPNLVLHELSHAYHDLVLSHNYEPIIEAYEYAIEMQLYDSVQDIAGNFSEAYATTNYKEYFAEITEAFWGKNDYYPFIREELALHDTLGYDVLVEIWLQ